MELVEVLETGPVMYVWRRRRGKRVRVAVASERATCRICYRKFWRWEGEGVAECGPCKWKTGQ